jgi:hypothetical protein
MTEFSSDAVLHHVENSDRKTDVIMPSIATLTRVNTRYFKSRSAQVQAAAVALHRFQVAIQQTKIAAIDGQRTTINRWLGGASGSSAVRSNPDSVMPRLSRELSSAAP